MAEDEARQVKPEDAEKPEEEEAKAPFNTSLPARRITFQTLRRQGVKMAEACRLSGLSRGAGYRLEQSLAQTESTGLDVQGVMSRDEGAATLSALLRDPNVPAAYKAPLASALTRLMSWDSAPPPVESQRQGRPDKLIDWLNRSYREMAERDGVCPACRRKIETTH